MVTGLFAQTPDGDNILYVDQNVSGGDGTGNSWANAIPELRDALAWAENTWDGFDAPLQIWVADGLYLPTDDNTDRVASFRLVNNVEIYGGFENGDVFEDRNPGDHPVILSGDIDANDSEQIISDPASEINGSNSYHVVTGSNIDNTALLDGVTITAGNANGSLPDNRGGGLYCDGEGSGNICSPTLTNIVFVGNRADDNGGAIWNDGRHSGNSIPVITNAVFTGNSAGMVGGAIFNSGYYGNSSAVLTNIVFVGNHADDDGGAIMNSAFGGNSSPVITNSIFWGNSAGDFSNEIRNNNATPILSYTLIEGGVNFRGITDGGGNTDSNPRFVDAANPAGDDGIFGTSDDGLALQVTSPAINAGSNQAYIDAGGDLDNDLDLAGELRVFDGVPEPDVIDMGAYEFQGDPLGIPDENNILYVDQNVSGGEGTGSSWVNAIPELRDAMTWAQNWDGERDGTLQIWVTDGFYLPTDNETDREASFQLANNVEIYGGFAGAENDVNARDWNKNLTILSGDIDNNDSTTNGITLNADDINGVNSYHVVTGSNIGNTALLDGVTITGGNANGSSQINNRGGGLYCDGEFSGDTCSPTLTNIIFAGNNASEKGGAIVNNGYFEMDSSPVITNVVFIGNRAAYGGAIYNDGYEGNSNPVITNTVFTGNSASSSGGAISNDGRNSGNSSPMITNSVFTGNSADYGGAMNNDSNGGTSTPVLTNSILWGNSAAISGDEIRNNGASSTLRHTLIEGGVNGPGVAGDSNTDNGGNIDANPMFVNVANPAGNDGIFGTPDDGLALRNISPAMNTGDNGAIPPGIATDLAGNDRIYNGGTVDMGAYELQSEPIDPDGNNILYVDQNVSGGDGNGISWANAIPELRDALAWAHDNWNGNTDGTLKIWVAEGLYLPTDDDTDREATFQLTNDVEIYGGFASGDGFEDRNPGDHPVILSGDIDNNDNTTNGITLKANAIDGNNSYHVVTGTNIGNTALLNGVTITAGRANGSSPDNLGGGLYCDGEGSGSTCSPTLTNIIFVGNRAGYGAAIFNDGRDNGNSSPVITNAVFTGNRANQNGGGIINYGNNGNSSPVITNAAFTGNRADINGGAILNNGSNGGTSTPVFSNSIFWGNSAGNSAGEIRNNNATPTISHTLKNENPMFVNAAAPAGDDGIFGTPDDGLALHKTSPAINTGSNQAYIDAGGDLDNGLDLAGELRVFDGLPDPDVIDIGAYEFQGEPVPIGLDGNNILYVDQNVSGDERTGNSWANAIPELRDALNWAENTWDGSEAPLQIWVADGLYLPTDDDTDRVATFQLINNVEIYGGFSGGENDVNVRDWNENLTILSGDINRNDDEEIIIDPKNEIKGNNSLHVVTGSNIDNTALLDGFIITAGRANLPADDLSTESCGGLFNENGSPSLANVVFAGNWANWGGGMCNIDGGSPVLTNVVFTGNWANYIGGGLLTGGDPTLMNVFFIDNSANLTGGGLYNIGSPILINNTFSRNRAGDRGGGMYNTGNPSLTNSTFSGNSTDKYEGGGIYNRNGNLTLTNTILWGNTAFDSGNEIFISDGSVSLDFSLYRNRDGQSDIVEGGGFTASNSLSEDPLFMDVANPAGDDGIFGTPDDGLALQNTSLAINAGTNAPYQSGGAAEGITTDLAGNDRIYDGGTVDMGAYEFQGEPVTVPDPVVLNSPADEANNVGLTPGFSWGSVDGADTYHLQISQQNDLSDPVIDESGLTGTTFEPTSDLGNSTTHYWQVRASNAVGDGSWSEVFSFTTMDQLEASDNRILLANNQPYTFSPADFGTADNSFTIVIDGLPGGFHGQLQLGESDVSTEDEISVGDIDDEKLTYTPPEGEYGYRYDSFDFSIEDSDGNPSEASYTMSLDVAAASVELNGGEGWRFLGNPSHDDRFDDLLRPLWTNGVAGSDSPRATFSNVNLLNQQEYLWEAPGDLGNTTKASQPFIVYVYSDDDNDGTPEGFPKTLTSGENWLPLDGSYSFDDLSFDETISNPDNFYLVANPHPLALDFCAFASTNIGTAVTFWNPNANGGNGDYQALNCETLEELPIAPFQAFWIRTTESNPALEILEEAYLETSTEGYFKESEMKEDLFRIVLNVASENREQGFSNRTELYFAENASATLEEMDAIKLSPEGLANRWLSFYSLDQNHKTYAFQSLPVSHLINDKVSIPLDVQTTESGRFTLDWTLPESHIFNGSYYLRDNKTGEVIELREGTSYDFEITPEQAVQTKQAGTTHPMSELAENGVIALDTHRMSSVAAPRFELLIAAAGVDGLTELGAVPEQFELGQNYPNPFNPTTVIRYQLPVSSEVRLEVYDMLGRNVATLVDEQVSAGRHTVNFDAGNLSSGIYLYRLEAGSQIMTRKLTVVK